MSFDSQLRPCSTAALAAAAAAANEGDSEGPGHRKRTRAQRRWLLFPDGLLQQHKRLCPGMQTFALHMVGMACSAGNMHMRWNPPACILSLHPIVILFDSAKDAGLREASRTQ